VAQAPFFLRLAFSESFSHVPDREFSFSPFWLYFLLPAAYDPQCIGLFLARRPLHVNGDRPHDPGPGDDFLSQIFRFLGFLFCFFFGFHLVLIVSPPSQGFGPPPFFFALFFFTIVAFLRCHRGTPHHTKVVRGTRMRYLPSAISPVSRWSPLL